MENPKSGLVGILKSKLDIARQQIQNLSNKLNLKNNEVVKLKKENKKLKRQILDGAKK